MIRGLSVVVFLVAAGLNAAEGRKEALERFRNAQIGPFLTLTDLRVPFSQAINELHHFINYMYHIRASDDDFESLVTRAFATNFAAIKMVNPVDQLGLIEMSAAAGRRVQVSRLPDEEVAEFKRSISEVFRAFVYTQELSLKTVDYSFLSSALSAAYEALKENREASIDRRNDLMERLRVACEQLAKELPLEHEELMASFNLRVSAPGFLRNNLIIMVLEADLNPHYLTEANLHDALNRVEGFVRSLRKLLEDNIQLFGQYTDEIRRLAEHELKFLPERKGESSAEGLHAIFLTQVIKKVSEFNIY